MCISWRTYGRVASVNAFYRILENALVFPAGILQDAVYSNDKPMYVNFGSLGMIMGHEMTHGFDDTGTVQSLARVLANNCFCRKTV